MATAYDTIRTAYKHLGALGQGKTLSAEQTSDALYILNGMMAGWKADGWAYTHTPLALADPVNVAAEHQEGLEHLLAMRLAPLCGAQVSTNRLQLIKAVADRGYDRLQAAYSPGAEITFPDGLQVTQAWPYGGIGRLR